MKKYLVISLVLVASTATFALSQDRDAQPPQFPGGRMLAEARTEDGLIDLSKLPKQMPKDCKAALQKADKDGDGFLTEEELKSIAELRSGRRDRDGRGPGFGGPQGGPNFFGDTMKDGKLDLSKLSEETPQELKDSLKAADKDGDGYLSEDELKNAMPRPKFQFPEDKKPDFVNDDNGIILAKLAESLKSFDKNSDGIIDEEEQKNLTDTVREKYGPSLSMFFQNILGGQRGMGRPGFGGSQGMGQPGFGPNGSQDMGQPGFGPGGSQDKNGKRTNTTKTQKKRSSAR